MKAQTSRTALLPSLIFGITLVLVSGCVGSRSAQEAVPEDMGEKVAVGYGQQDKDRLTTAVSSVDVENTRQSSVQSIQELMQGRVAGVHVMQTPSGFSVRIRGAGSIHGSSEPLYVVDGMPLATGPRGLISLNPNDVASIEVLKDAGAAAVYGWRGAHGVVLITTKRGR